MSKPKINQMITAYNYSKRPKPFDKNGYIVIHWVGGVSTAKNNAQYFNGGNRNASAHFFVDDKSIWQIIKTKNYYAWHCGDGHGGTKGKVCYNYNSIGIEMCCKKDSKGNLYITDKTIERTALLVKWLMEYYNVPASHVIRHYDVSQKHCPAPYVDATKWKELKAKLTK